MDSHWWPVNSAVVGEGLQHTLTPYAVDLMTQFGMSVSNRPTPEQENDTYYLVEYAGDAKFDKFTPVAQDDGSTVSWHCDSDFGLGDFPGHAGHITSLYDCTCQYPSVFRLPCRHILHLHMQK